MRRAFYIIMLALISTISHAQSIADLARQAEEEKNPLHIYSSIGNYNNGLYIVRKEVDEYGTSAYGVVDEEANVFIPIEYDRISFVKEGDNYRENLYKCELNGKWGFVSSTQGTLLPCDYSSLSSEDNNIWRTSKNNRYGYVKLNGVSSVTTLIPCTYESIETYSSAPFIHAVNNGRCGMIDGQNKIIIPFEYSNVSDLCLASNGEYIIWVEKDGMHGIYSNRGKKLQSCDIDKAYTLTSGNIVTELSYTDCPSAYYIYIVRNGLTGIMSGSSFEQLIPCTYEYLSPVMSDKVFYKANGKWGIVNTSNQTVQLAVYDNVEIGGCNLSEKVMPSMAFRENMYVCRSGKVGMLKASGEDFIPVQYDSLGVYSDEMLGAKVGATCGFLNAEGKEAVPFVYSQIHAYSEGLAAVVNEKGKYLFIDKSGNVAIKPKEYDKVGEFKNGTCKVYRKGKVWEIDKEGKKVKDFKRTIDLESTIENMESSNQEPVKSTSMHSTYIHSDDMYTHSDDMYTHSDDEILKGLWNSMKQKCAANKRKTNL